jgi:hypothetical protein
VGAIFYASEAISNVSGPQRDLTAYIAQPISDYFKLQVYGLHGFANGSPDWAGGLMATLRF